MPLFDYVGQLESGATFVGTLEAGGQEEAHSLLAQMGVRLTSLRPAKRAAYVAPLSLDDFTFFNEQLAALTKAGMPLEEGLRQLAADVGSRRLKRLLLDLSDDLAAGTPLEQALARHQRRFPAQYAEVVEAGLKTGDLSGTLYGLTTHLRLKSYARRSLVELVMYPLVVLALALLVLAFIMRHVAPQIQQIVLEFAGAQAAGFAGYRHLSATIAAWPVIEAVLGALILLIVVLWAATCAPRARPLREWLLRRIPGIAQVYWSSVLARFAHTSALAAGSGTPLPELVAAGGAASGSPALAHATRRVADRLTAGETLTEAAADEPVLPALWTCVVSATAPRGELPAALAELARAYELRAQQWVTTLRLILGPVLLLLVASILGGVIATMLSVMATVIRSVTVI